LEWRRAYLQQPQFVHKCKTLWMDGTGEKHERRAGRAGPGQHIHPGIGIRFALAKIGKFGAD
jgi:hypothetical protein